MIVSTPKPSLIEAVRAKLEGELSPVSLIVQDQSAVHHGHAGAKGGGHLSVRIVSRKFAGLSLVERHRLVYGALAQEMGAQIHALALETKAPGEK